MNACPTPKPVPVPMPTAELVDRYTITELKRERLGENERTMLEAQLAYYGKGINWHDHRLMILMGRLKAANELMWDAEAAIREGQDEELGLVEIGRRALRIRDLNRDRVAIKNEISDYVDDGMGDVKVNYARAA